MVVQRLVNAERTLRLQAEALAAEKAEEAESLKGELTVLQVRWTLPAGMLLCHLHDGLQSHLLFSAVRSGHCILTNFLESPTYGTR